MPTPTYTPLANITLGSSAASVTFSSISQAYRDLVLVIQVKTSTTSTPLLRFNSDSGPNYNYVYARGNGSTTLSAQDSNQTATYLGSVTYADTSDAHMSITNVFDYSAVDKQKTVLSRSNVAVRGTDMFTHRWASTSAITAVNVISEVGTFASGSTFALYGIAA